MTMFDPAQFKFSHERVDISGGFLCYRKALRGDIKDGAFAMEMQYHNESGPAIYSCMSGKSTFYLDGREVTFAEWFPRAKLDPESEVWYKLHYV